MIDSTHPPAHTRCVFMLPLLTAGRHGPLLDTTDIAAEHGEFKAEDAAEGGRIGDIEELDVAYPDDDVGESTE